MSFGSGLAYRGKSSLLILRLMLILAAAVLLLPPGFQGTVPAIGTVMIALFLLSNAVLMAVPDVRLLTQRSDFLIVLADTALVAVCLFHVKAGQGELAVAFFVVLLLSAMGRDVLRIVVTATFVAGLYTFLTWRTGLVETLPLQEALLRVPFLYISGLYYGCSVMRVREDQKHAAALETERRDLETFLAVTAATTSSLHLHGVLNSIVRKVAQMVGAVRCSLVLMEDNGRKCVVMASNDKPEMDQITIDLEKYPELRQAIKTRDTVVVNDVDRDPLMQAARESLEGQESGSILVVPLMFGKEMLGMLSVRARRPDKSFTPEDVKGCQVVANASATALKNAILFEQMEDEANRRKATSEVLANIMQHFPDMIFMADLKGHFTDLNRGGEEILGVKRDDVLGTPTSAIFAGGGVPDPKSLLERGGSVSGRQVLLKRSDGELRPGIAAIAFLRDQKGEPSGIVGVCKDLSELKKAQRQLQEAQNSATLESVGRYAGELNYALEELMRHARLIESGQNTPDAIMAPERVVDAAIKCQTIVQRLHDWSRGHDSEPQLVGAGARAGREE